MNQFQSLAARIVKANSFLDSRIRAASVPGACDEIARILHEHRTYPLFRELFPARWEASATGFHRSKGRMGGVPGRVAEFFELVNSELFPILDDLVEDPYSDEPPVFTVRPLNIDFCCEEFEVEDLRTSLVAGLMLFGGSDGDSEAIECLEERTGLNRESLPVVDTFPHDDVWSEPPRTGRTMLYRNALEFIDHSTGNPWLDATWCQPSQLIVWTSDSVRFLANAYRDAERRIEAIDRLDRLIERDPERILGEMIRYWNTGVARSMHAAERA